MFWFEAVSREIDQKVESVRQRAVCVVHTITLSGHNKT
jgi:hypothetical protein